MEKREEEDGGNIKGVTGVELATHGITGVAQKGHEQQEEKHTKIDEISPIHIIDSSEQLAQRSQGEQSQG